MSSPMEVSLQNPPDAELCNPNGVSQTESSPFSPVEKVLVSGTRISPSLFYFYDYKILTFFFSSPDGIAVEVCLKPSSTARIADVQTAVERSLSQILSFFISFSLYPTWVFSF